MSSKNTISHPDYIETLREESNFCEKMKDPVKELFDSLERRSIPEPDPAQPAKKVCIIFHGAPFTGNIAYDDYLLGASKIN